MNARTLKVKDLCDERVLAIEHDCSLYDTIRWLDEHGAGRAVVLDGSRGASRAAGIVDRKTLAATMLSRPDYDDLILFDVMDAEPVIVSEHEEIHVAFDKLRNAGRHVAVVVNESGELAGLLTLNDVRQLDRSGRQLATAA